MISERKNDQRISLREGVFFSPLFSLFCWEIFDIHQCISLRCTKRWFELKCEWWDPAPVKIRFLKIYFGVHGNLSKTMSISWHFWFELSMWRHYFILLSFSLRSGDWKCAPAAILVIISNFRSRDRQVYGSDHLFYAVPSIFQRIH